MRTGPVQDSDAQQPIYFVLRVRDTELLLKMYDRSESAKKHLDNLKRKNFSKFMQDRSKLIRFFIRDQLDSGSTHIYAYKDRQTGAWVRAKPQEVDAFRRDLSPVADDPHGASPFQLELDDGNLNANEKRHANDFKAEPWRDQLVPAEPLASHSVG